VDEQLEVVIELRGDTEAPRQPVMARDRLAVVGDGDRPRADLGQNPQPDKRDWHRVAVLANRDEVAAAEATWPDPLSSVRRL
jgi:hypothetical protein